MKVTSSNTPTETTRTTHRERLEKQHSELLTQRCAISQEIVDIEQRKNALHGESPCGCLIVDGTIAGGAIDPTIIFCPKHAAVDELLASFDELHALFFPGDIAANAPYLDRLQDVFGHASGAVIARMLTAMRRARPEGGHDDSDAPKTPTAEELLQELLAVFEIFKPSRMVLLANSAGCRDGAKVSSADADDLRSMAAAAQAIIDKVAGMDGK